MESSIVLQVNSVSFFEHHSIEGEQAPSSSGPPHDLRHLCVMETEVTNKTEGPLQVHSVGPVTFAFSEETAVPR